MSNEERRPDEVEVNEEVSAPREPEVKEETHAPAAKATGWSSLSSNIKTAIIAGVSCVVIAVAVLVILLGGLFGGGDDNNAGGGAGGGDGKITYTITVQDEEGNPVANAKVAFIVGSTPITANTNTQGKATYETSKSIKASVVSVPNTFAYTDYNKKYDFDANGNLTITLEKADLGDAVIVRVVDQNGDVVPGARVQVCDDQCLPRFTSADGEAYYYLSEINIDHPEIHAQLLSLPDGYTGDYDEYHYFEDGLVEITVTKN